LAKENTANFLKLKYELKKALSLTDTNAAQSVKVSTEPNRLNQPLLKEIIKQWRRFLLKTMAMYPMELHSTYRQRVSDFYLACELKFQLNSITDDDETMRLPLLFNSMICGPGLIVRG
jgi:hypothetical protein